MNLEPDTSLMQTLCKSCPFQADGIKLDAKKMSEIVGYLIQGVNHLCHSDKTHHTICRGGRDYQLEIWHRQSIIKEPTDAALHEAMIESGINPGEHIKRSKSMHYIEAIQFLATKQSFDDICGMSDTWLRWKPGEMGTDTFSIETLEGDMLVSKGDWVIKGLEGEIYPCKDDIFQQAYEKVGN